MRTLVFLLAICLASVVAFPESRIAGGGLAVLSQHPYSAAILYAQNNVNFRQTCGAAIINNRSALTAVYCFTSDSNLNTYRLRTGSLNATAGGILHNVGLLRAHPNYNSWNLENNIAILRTSTIITFTTSVRPIPIAGSNYVLADYQSVWAIGWGRTTAAGVASEQLRRVEILTVNQVRCQDIYGVGFVTGNMLCAGWPTGGRGSCVADTGSPLVHNNVAVGVTSYSLGCGDANFPAVYTRLSRYTSWIQTNA